MGKAAQKLDIPECVVADCHDLVERNSTACVDHMDTVALRRLWKQRDFQVVNKVARKTPVAEDLFTILETPIGSTVERLLDGLAGLAVATSAAQGKTLDAVRGRPQHAPLPSWASAWAEHVQSQLDDRLWEISETLLSFLNRPTDPKEQAGCDQCGNKRIGDATYCHSCGARISEGARRCRQVGCSNEGGRRSACRDH